MLESIRNRSNGPVAKFIIGLIIIPFAFAGVYSYFGVSSSNAVATVNGDEISLAEFDRSYRLRQQRFGDDFYRYFNNDEQLQQFRINVLQQLINQRLSTQAIDEMGLRTSDDGLRKVIMAAAEFKDENGNFDVARYEFGIQSRGYTARQYQAIRKADMASSQLVDTLRDSNFVLSNELNLNKRLRNQKRDIEYLIIPQDYYANQVDLSGDKGDIAINSYYEMNKSQFGIPEKVSIKYLYIKKGNPTDIVISNGQVADYYDENISSFETNQRRRVAHILLTVSADASNNDIAAIEDKIKSLKSRIDAGESFENLAIEYSQDSVTAELGGDLDWIEKGMMDQSFEDIAFNLEVVNTVSSIVRSDFGFHLIKLLEVDSGAAKSVDELHSQIAEILQNKFVEDKYFDLKELVSIEVFENPDSLDDIANTIGFSVIKSNLFDRLYGIGMPVELQNQPAILEAAYSDDVLYQDYNSKLIELTDDTAVVLRLLQHQEAGVKLLADVRTQVSGILVSQRAREAAEKVGNLILSSLNDNKTTTDVLSHLPKDIAATWQKQQGLSRDGTEVDFQIRNGAFEILEGEEGRATRKGFMLVSGDFAVVTLLGVTQGEIKVDEATDLKLDKQFMDYHAQAEIYNYIKYLDAQASISRTIRNADMVQ